MGTLGLFNPVGEGQGAGGKMAVAFSPKKMIDAPVLGYGLAGFYASRIIHSATKMAADKAGFQQAMPNSNEAMDWKDWVTNLATAVINIGLGRFFAQYMPGDRQDSWMTGVYAGVIQSLVAAPLANAFPQNRFLQYLGDPGDWGGSWAPTPDLPVGESSYGTEEIVVGSPYYEEAEVGESYPDVYNQAVLEGEETPFMAVGGI